LQRQRPAAGDVEQPELRRAAAALQDRAIADNRDRRGDRRDGDAVLGSEE